jgi:hypothetical protein
MNGLFGYEKTAMVDAIRRDMHAEEEKANTDPQWRDWHLENVRIDKRILDTVNPKHTQWK